MKKILIFMVLLLSITFLNSCDPNSNNPSPEITGKIDDFFGKELVMNNLTLDSANARFYDRNYYDVLKKCKVVFYPNGKGKIFELLLSYDFRYYDYYSNYKSSYNLVYPEYKESGMLWEINDDNTQIFLMDSSTNRSIILDILKLSKDEMVLGWSFNYPLSKPMHKYNLSVKQAKDSYTFKPTIDTIILGGNYPDQYTILIFGEYLQNRTYIKPGNYYSYEEYTNITFASKNYKVKSGFNSEGELINFTTPSSGKFSIQTPYGTVEYPKEFTFDNTVKKVFLKMYPKQ